MAKAIGGKQLKPRARKNRLDAELLASLVEVLASAEAGVTLYSGLVRDTKTAAGSDGYAYRNALVKEHGIPCSSVVRTVEEVRSQNEGEKDLLDAYKGMTGAHFTWAIVRTEATPPAPAADQS